MLRFETEFYTEISDLTVAPHYLLQTISIAFRPMRKSDRWLTDDRGVSYLSGPHNCNKTKIKLK